VRWTTRILPSANIPSFGRVNRVPACIGLVAPSFVSRGDETFLSRNGILRLALLMLCLASGSFAAVPDSLLPDRGFRLASSDPEAGARLGKYLMIGGAAGIAIGGVIRLTEIGAAGADQLKCASEGDGNGCSEDREFSAAGSGFLIAGIVALPLGILIAAVSRDDSGRDRKYYGSVGPRRIEAGYRREF